MLILLIWDRTLTPKQEKEPHAGHAVDSKRDKEDGSKAQPESPLPVEGEQIFSRDSKRDKEGDSKAQPESPLPVESERIFSRRTPEELIALVKDKTEWAASDLTKPHIGTWLRIKGPIYNIRPPSDNTVTVAVDFSRGYPTLLVFLSFDETPWRERLRILDIGDSITAIGKISQINKTNISLEECELIGH